MLAAGPAIVAAAQHARKTGASWKSPSAHHEAITAKMVCRWRRKSDPVALQIVTQAATYLGIGIANLLNILTPEIVVLGGGVMQSWSLFRPPSEQIVNAGKSSHRSAHSNLPTELRLNADKCPGAAFPSYSLVLNNSSWVVEHLRTTSQTALNALTPILITGKLSLSKMGCDGYG